MELIDKQILHTFCIIDAALKLMLGVLIRHSAYHSSFASSSQHRCPWWYLAVREWRQGEEGRLMRRAVVGIRVRGCIGGNPAYGVVDGGFAWP